MPDLPQPMTVYCNVRTGENCVVTTEEEMWDRLWEWEDFLDRMQIGRVGLTEPVESLDRGQLIDLFTLFPEMTLATLILTGCQSLDQLIDMSELPLLNVSYTVDPDPLLGIL